MQDRGLRGPGLDTSELNEKEVGLVMETVLLKMLNKVTNTAEPQQQSSVDHYSVFLICDQGFPSFELAFFLSYL